MVSGRHNPSEPLAVDFSFGSSTDLDSAVQMPEAAGQGEPHRLYNGIPSSPAVGWHGHHNLCIIPK